MSLHPHRRYAALSVHTCFRNAALSVHTCFRNAALYLYLTTVMRPFDFRLTRILTAAVRPSTKK